MKTSEYDEPDDPEFNPYVWDSERIEATKTLLFYEFIAQGGGMYEDE